MAYENHIGEGFINYTVELKSGAQSGTRVDAKAKIVFDNNDAIEEPVVLSEYINIVNNINNSKLVYIPFSKVFIFKINVFTF